ncbi:hypothetical protein CCR75_009639 [Bremia lactucae]|uniref:Uncharacterized protein n=1 Tax=Bremia lactucae TaxID=4779 RepID=A0A976FKQ5_BRELC|nr:hypothetical protein CCR75_009639 [Bremia lactucae]
MAFGSAITGPVKDFETKALRLVSDTRDAANAVRLLKIADNEEKRYSLNDDDGNQDNSSKISDDSSDDASVSSSELPQWSYDDALYKRQMAMERHNDTGTLLRKGKEANNFSF